MATGGLGLFLISGLSAPPRMRFTCMLGVQHCLPACYVQANFNEPDQLRVLERVGLCLMAPKTGKYSLTAKQPCFLSSVPGFQDSVRHIAYGHNTTLRLSGCCSPTACATSTGHLRTADECLDESTASLSSSGGARK